MPQGNAPHVQASRSAEHNVHSRQRSKCKRRQSLHSAKPHVSTSLPAPVKQPVTRSKTKWSRQATKQHSTVSLHSKQLYVRFKVCMFRKAVIAMLNAESGIVPAPAILAAMAASFALLSSVSYCKALQQTEVRRWWEKPPILVSAWHL